MGNIKRVIQARIEEKLFQGKVLVIYGARQVGKTTLVREILKKYPENSLYLNCDETDIREALTDKTSTELKEVIGHKKLVVIDEAQRIKNIGLTLKLLVDQYPEIQLIATGSSSFDLSNQIIEPLTGRHYEFSLHTFSAEELRQIYEERDIQRSLERRLIYGMYPEVVLQTEENAETLIKSIAKSYLYKDILVFQNIKHSESLEKLLQALALQIGNEVSYNELAGMVGTDKNTVAHYIQILEKAFIVFRLSPFSRNLRNELKKTRKIYFWDTGIRNAIINNFNPLSLRQDTGALWENFLISERIKRNHNKGETFNRYFWRTHAQQEIDYIEEAGGKIRAFEFKWQDRKTALSKVFLSAYPGAEMTVIHQKNWLPFVM